LSATVNNNKLSSGKEEVKKQLAASWTERGKRKNYL